VPGAHVGVGGALPLGRHGLVLVGLVVVRLGLVVVVLCGPPPGSKQARHVSSTGCSRPDPPGGGGA
jgi:hypothetical protein